MRKIVRQQNYLKELIESQGNQFLTKTALKCLIRSVLEPLLDTPEDGVVLQRIENKEGLQGLLKRLEFSEIESVDYSDKSAGFKFAFLILLYVDSAFSFGAAPSV